MDPHDASMIHLFAVFTLNVFSVEYTIASMLIPTLGTIRPSCAAILSFSVDLKAMTSNMWSLGNVQPTSTTTPPMCKLTPWESIRKLLRPVTPIGLPSAFSFLITFALLAHLHPSTSLTTHLVKHPSSIPSLRK